MKKLMISCLVVMVLGIFSQDSFSAQSEVAVLMPSLQGYIYVAKAYGIMDEADQLKIARPIMLGSGGYDKLDVQVKQIEDMIASGIKAIILQPLSTEAITPALDKAVDRGIKIVEMGNESNSKKINARRRTDQVEIGRMMARAIGKNLNGNGNVVMFNGPAGASWSKLETDGFKEVMSKQYPNVKILGERYTVYDAGVAMNTMNDYLQGFKDIDYVYCAWDTYAEGAARAIKMAGKGGQIKIVSAGLTEVTVPLLKEGLATYVVAANPILEARICLRTAVKLIKGEKVPLVEYVPLNGFTAENFKGAVDLSNNFYPKGWTIPN